MKSINLISLSDSISNYYILICSHHTQCVVLLSTVHKFLLRTLKCVCYVFFIFLSFFRARIYFSWLSLNLICSPYDSRAAGNAHEKHKCRRRHQMRENNNSEKKKKSNEDVNFKLTERMHIFMHFIQHHRVSSNSSSSRSNSRSTNTPYMRRMCVVVAGPIV